MVKNFVFVLDNVRSAFNVGSIFRTADGLGFGIHLIGITPIPGRDKKLEKTSLNTIPYVSWMYFRNASEWLNSIGQEESIIVAVENLESTKSISLFDLPSRLSFFANDASVYVVLGHEINGVSSRILDVSHLIVRIPMYGTKNSLNVANCAGIIGYFAILPKFKSDGLDRTLLKLA